MACRPTRRQTMYISPLTVSKWNVALPSGPENDQVIAQTRFVLVTCSNLSPFGHLKLLGDASNCLQHSMNTPSVSLNFLRSSALNLA